MTAARPSLRDFSPESLRARFKSEGLSAYRADQVGAWLYEIGRAHV